MYDEQTSKPGGIPNQPGGRRPMEALGRRTPPASPDTSVEAFMPSKLRRTSLTLKAKTYRSAASLVSLLVLLEALGAPRKL